MVIGRAEKIPWFFVWIGFWIVLAMALQARHCMKTPTGENKEKRDAFLSVMGESFRITENYSGDKAPFFHALAQAQVVFRNDENVNKTFSQIRNNPGHDSVLLPELLVAMGNSCGIKVETSDFKTFFAPNQNS